MKITFGKMQPVTAAGAGNSDNAALIAAINRSFGVIEFKLDGTILTANSNFLAIVGYTLAEIVGKHHSMFVAPAYRGSAEYRQFWEKLGRGQFDRGQYNRIGKGGKHAWLEASYNPVFDGQGKAVKIVKFATDITARKLKEDQDSKALQAALDASNAHNAQILAAETAAAQTGQELENVVAAVIGGDLRARIQLAGKVGFMESLSQQIDALIDCFAEVVGNVQSAAAEVARGVQEVAQGNEDLSQRTEAQASSLEETASSMEQMTASVRQNADNSGQANQLAVAARDQADKGGAVVAKAVKAMSDINQSSKKIADIIGVIDEIAFQTNLLALNAAVEAARAGEQGRGFAVVASEVRNLAGRSATAAKEIKGLIRDSVQKVDEGSMLVAQSGETLEHIVMAVKKVSDIIAEIAASSQEQTSGIEQVNKAVMQLDEMTQQNAALVEQATAASKAISEQSQALSATMARFEVGHAQAPAAARSPQRAAVRAAARPKSSNQNSSQSSNRSAAARAANHSGPARAAAARPNKPKPQSAPAATAAPPVRGKVAVGDDSTWEQF